MEIWILSAALLVAASVAVFLYFGHGARSPKATGDRSKKALAEQETDTYLDYRFEEVMFRETGSPPRIYMKFYGSTENTTPIPATHRLYYEASTHGEPITKEQYIKGKPARMINE